MTSAIKGRVANGTPKAWVELPDEDLVRPMMENNPYNFGFVPAMPRLLMAHPRLAPVFMQLYGEIMFSPESVLTRAEREMVAAVTSVAQDCFY